MYPVVLEKMIELRAIVADFENIMDRNEEAQHAYDHRIALFTVQCPLVYLLFASKRELEEKKALAQPKPSGSPPPKPAVPVYASLLLGLLGHPPS